MKPLSQLDRGDQPCPLREYHSDNFRIRMKQIMCEQKIRSMHWNRGCGIPWKRWVNL